MFDSYASAALFRAIKDTSILNHIFQKGPDIIDIFIFGGFTFRLLDSEPHRDIYYYEIAYDYFHKRFIICGITASPYCGPSSNNDLVDFIWHNFGRFNSIKYAMLL